ncbi:MAG TPA: SAM-dependent methyltransferase [Lentisphaeria bacterium]|nr:MAG: hypothetical protein A2X47_04130 [Lentisphaerae bacterium GWF2_38_69]HBM16177.1 SAM-dependent methyltransferase [Lentisphaeria bacterium]
MENKSKDQYQILDSGNLQKLEQVGSYRLIRPALNAFWPISLPKKEWDNADAIFQRNSSGGGKWTWRNKLPQEWLILYNSITFLIKPTNFGHLGFFPEQKNNWIWLRSILNKCSNLKTINLFAYSGGSSLAMAQTGAKVCHVDAAKGMVDWAKMNLSNNTEINTSIRWIVDDVSKFLHREAARKETYDGIVLDPPSFGRGPNGQVWKIENDIIPLLEKCKNVLSPNPKFILLSLHSHGFSDNTLKRILQFVFGEKNQVDCGEMILTESTGKNIDAGSYARLTFK